MEKEQEAGGGERIHKGHQAREGVGSRFVNGTLLVSPKDAGGRCTPRGPPTINWSVGDL